MFNKSRTGLFLFFGFLVLFSINLTGCLSSHNTVTVLTPTTIPVFTLTPQPVITKISISKPSNISIYFPKTTSVPAFPGAEGFGSMGVGGRGGKVIEVINLNDSGPGSLRQAINTQKPRIIVFRVAGTIKLKTSLIITSPYVTIAGQTAPGGGITLRTDNAKVEALLDIETHDVIVRFLTFRAGPPSAGDAMEIFASKIHDTYNVVIDHNSLSWAVSRNLATWYDVHDITIQWNIFSEGLNCSIHPKGCHSKGVLLGSYANNENQDKPGAYNISLHHNLMAHNGERNPYIEVGGIVDVVNNVAYNPFDTFSHIDMADQMTQDRVNFIGNYFKPGPNTEVKYSVKAINPGKPGAGIFVQGNIGPKRSSDTQPEISIIEPNSRKFVVSKVFPARPVTTTTALQAYSQVLARAGANRGLNCDGTFFARQDKIDARIINDVRKGTGKIIDSPSQVGGWLTILPAPACADSDHDGMPNLWEHKYGFNPASSLDASKDIDMDGYTNIEEFLNGTNPLK